MFFVKIKNSKELCDIFDFRTVLLNKTERLAMKILFAFALTFIGLALHAQPKEGLVAHWSFDKWDGNKFLDASGNSNHGTNYGADIIEGIRGNALFFNGENDFATIPEDGKKPPGILSKLGKGSISIWFKVNHIPPKDGIAPLFYYGTEKRCDFFDAANKGMIIEVGHSPIHYGSENLYFTMWKNGCTYPSFCYDSGTPIPEGIWQHLVVVVGENYNTGYLNGEEMSYRRYNFGNSSYSQFFEDAISHEKLWLGKGYWDRKVQHLKGAIDEIRIYDRPLTSAEVKDLYRDTVLSSKLQKSRIETDINIFPNPASHEISYNINKREFQAGKIIINDISGRKLKELKINKLSGRINVSGFSPGTYFINFHGSKATVKKKINLKK